MRPINRAHALPKIEDLDLIKRLMNGLDVDEDGYWLWAKCKDEHGYGKIWWNGKSQWVHRISYAVFCGPIPDDYTVDHGCYKRNCCNPKCLEAVTQSENSIRMRRRALCSTGATNE